MPPDVPAPGSLTVPPLAGWEGIVLALAAVLAVAVLFLAVGAWATSRRRLSPEWQAWLAGRSRPRIGSPAPVHVADVPDEGVGLFGGRTPR